MKRLKPVRPSHALEPRYPSRSSLRQAAVAAATAGLLGLSVGCKPNRTAGTPPPVQLPGAARQPVEETADPCPTETPVDVELEPKPGEDGTKPVEVEPESAEVKPESVQEPVRPQVKGGMRAPRKAAE